MLRDAFGGRHHCDNGAAVSAFERAVRRLAAHGPLIDALDEASRHDPALVAPHALRGIANVIVAKKESIEVSRRGLALTRATIAACGGGSPSEQALADAHALAAEGQLSAAALRLETHVRNDPRDFLAIKLAHALRFMTGDARMMLATTSSALRHWSDTAPGYGYLLGCHAFALEETGNLIAAEAAGRRAVEHEPADVWALHAVAHVMEMSNRTAEGIAWLEASTQTWPHCGGFGFHMAWHLALFHLSEGDHEQALALYDRHMVPTDHCDFRDMANAASLLWRIEQEGFDVGDRWHHVATIAEKRRLDTSYVFASMHYLLALVAAGRTSAGRDLALALRDSAQDDKSDQAGVAREVGVELADAILGLGDHQRSRTDLATVAGRLPQLGGSNAQRDVFLRTLMLVAVKTGDGRSMGRLSSIRHQQRREDRFEQLVQRLAVRQSRMSATVHLPLNFGYPS